MATEIKITSGNSVSEISKVEKAYKNLELRTESVTRGLGKQILATQNLEKQYDSLKRRSSTLTAEFKRSVSTVNSLKATVNVLEKEVEQLTVAYKKQEAEIKTLTASYNTLQKTQVRSAAINKKAITDQANVRSAIRGTAGALGGLWLAYGNILPMLGAFAAALTVKEIIAQGAAFDYTATFIDTLATVSGEASINIEDMKDKLFSFTGLRKDVNELALGMKEFSKAGVDVSLGLENIEELARFATVAELGLSEATALVIGQANAFGVSYADAANMITAAATSSATSITEMAGAMSHTTELGSVAKVTFDEVATALAVMANSGIRGSKAGTAIRTSIIRMQTPTKKLKGMLADLNVEFSSFTEDGKVKSIRNMFGELERATDILVDEEKIKVMRELFGLRAMKGGANVLREINEGWDDLNKHVNESVEGITLLEQASDKLDETTIGKWEKLKTSVINLITETGDSAATKKTIQFLLDVANATVTADDKPFIRMSERADEATQRMIELNTAQNKSVTNMGGMNIELFKIREHLENSKEPMDSWIANLDDAHAILIKLNPEMKAAAEAISKMSEVDVSVDIGAKVDADLSSFFNSLDSEALKGPDLESFIAAEEEAAKKLEKIAEEVTKHKAKVNMEAAKQMDDIWLDYESGREKANERATKFETATIKERLELQTTLTEELKGLTLSEKDFSLWALDEEVAAMREAAGEDVALQDMITEYHKLQNQEILDDNNETLQLMLEHWQSFTEEFKSTLSDSIVGAIKGDFDSIEDAWNSLWDSMLSKMADVLVEMAVTWTISNVSTLFDGWEMPKFHDGLWNMRGDEMPAILQKGEMVIPKDHAEGIRDNLGELSNSDTMFGDIVDSTSLSGPPGWNDTFSGFLGDEIASKSKWGLAEFIGTQDMESTLAGMFSPSGMVDMLGSALMSATMSAMGLTGDWAQGGYMVGSVLTALGLSGNAVPGATSIGGFFGAVAGDAIGDAFDMREHEEMRDALEDMGMNPEDIATEVQNMEAYQDTLGSLTKDNPLSDTTTAMSELTGVEFGMTALKEQMEQQLLDNIIASQPLTEADLDKMTKAELEALLSTPQGVSLYEGLKELDFTDADTAASEARNHAGLDTISSDPSAHEPFGGRTGGPEGESQEGSFGDGKDNENEAETGTSGLGGYASGGVIKNLVVPEGEDGFAAVQYDEGIIDGDTMKVLSKAIHNGVFSGGGNSNQNILVKVYLSEDGLAADIDRVLVEKDDQGVTGRAFIK